MAKKLLALLALGWLLGPAQAPPALGLNQTEPLPPDVGQVEQTVEQAGGLGGAGDPSQITWSLAPLDGAWGTGRAYFSYIGAPGSVVEDGLVVANHSTRPINLRVYAADALNTPDGHFDLAPAAASAQGSGAWIELPELAASGGVLHLEAGQTTTVGFKITWPSDATPGDWAAGLVTSLDGPASQATVGVDSRLALRVYTTVSGQLTPGLTVADLSMVATASANLIQGSQIQVSYNLVNTGNARLVPTEQVTATGLAGIGKRQVSGTLDELLPGSTVARQVTVTGLLPLGRANVKVQVDGLAVGLGAEGQPASASAQASGWLVPWLWLAILAVAAGGTSWLARRHGGRLAVTAPLV